MPSYIIVQSGFDRIGETIDALCDPPASPAFLTVEPTCPSESSLSQSKYLPSTTTPARSFGA